MYFKGSKIMSVKYSYDKNNKYYYVRN